MSGLIYVGIASYRDKDLLRTVKNAYKNAVNKDKLYFSIYAQVSEEEVVDLSFIPPKQLNYMVVPYTEAMGVCYARYIANYSVSPEFDYFLQIDSHSRFAYGWDVALIDAYEKAKAERWGERLIFSASASSFEIEWNEDGSDYTDTNFETFITSNKPRWDDDEHMFLTEPVDYEGDDLGQEVFYICGGFVFTSGKIMSEVPYDPYLYHWGEEITLTLRAYTRGITIVAPPISVVYTNFSRENSRRSLHWEDSPDKWDALDVSSKVRAAHVLKGIRGLGVYGIDSRLRYEEYQKRAGVDLINQNYLT